MRTIRDGEPRTATSTFAQFLNSVQSRHFIFLHVTRDVHIDFCTVSELCTVASLHFLTRDSQAIFFPQFCKESLGAFCRLFIGFN